VVGFRDDEVVLLPLGELHGVAPGAAVTATGGALSFRAAPDPGPSSTDSAASSTVPDRCAAVDGRTGGTGGGEPAAAVARWSPGSGDRWLPHAG
jgi:hypothetical protein